MLQPDAICLHISKLRFTLSPSQYPGHFHSLWPLRCCVVHFIFVSQVAIDPSREWGIAAHVKTAC